MTNEQRRQAAAAKMVANAARMGIPTVTGAAEARRPKLRAVGNTLILKGPQIVKEEAGGLIAVPDAFAQKHTQEKYGHVGFEVLDIGPEAQKTHPGVNVGDRVLCRQLAEVTGTNNLTGEPRVRILEHVVGKFSEMFQETPDWVMLVDASLVIATVEPLPLAVNDPEHRELVTE